jgi:hypothetical protein
MWQNISALVLGLIRGFTSTREAEAESEESRCGREEAEDDNEEEVEEEFEEEDEEEDEEAEIDESV